MSEDIDLWNDKGTFRQFERDATSFKLGEKLMQLFQL